MQVVLHQFPGAQVEYRFKCRNAGVDLVPYIDEIQRRDRAPVLAALHRARTRLPARPALHQERLRRFSRPVPDEPQVHLGATPRKRRRARSTSSSRVPGCTRSCSRSRCSRSSTRSTFANTVADPDYDEGRRRLRHEDRADPRPARPRRHPHRRLRHAAPLLARLARRGASVTCKGGLGAELRRHLQRDVRDAATACCRSGTMAHEYLQACQALGPRLRDSQVFGFESWAQRVPRRPRHRAVGRLRFRRVPARLRHVLLQAVRRRAARFGRPLRLGRAADRALRVQPRRPAIQDAGVLRRAHLPADGISCTCASRIAPRSRSASAPT